MSELRTRDGLTLFDQCALLVALSRLREYREPIERQLAEHGRANALADLTEAVILLVNDELRRPLSV